MGLDLLAGLNTHANQQALELQSMQAENENTQTQMQKMRQQAQNNKVSMVLEQSQFMSGLSNKINLSH